MTLLRALLCLSLSSSALAAGKEARVPRLPSTPIKAAASASARVDRVAAAPAAQGGSAVAAINAVYADLGKPSNWSPSTVLNSAFDGWMKKGSVEARFRAPDAVDGFVDLSKLDPADRGGLKNKKIQKLRKAEKKKLETLQETFYGSKQRAAVISVNGIDTAGKDGRIKAIFKGLNPHSASVVSVKQPSAEDVKHHYLWRHVKVLPGPGKIVLFNRSYYEDVIVPLVFPDLYEKAWGHRLSDAEIGARLDEMNLFEKRLVDEGHIVVKFFLHISKKEQKKRLEKRRDDPAKNYKFSTDDLKTRRHWDAYHRAWGLILARTNTDTAPFFVVPADDKRYADYVVRAVTRRALKRAHLRFPKADPNVGKIVIPD